MSEYFDMCDVSPNSEFTRVNAMVKKEIYSQYCKEQSSLDPDTAIVTESMFNQLWSVVYPYCVQRVHCNIPGKCEICGTIDKLRRSSSARVTLLYLKKAHYLHRGGMFMMERKRYCIYIILTECSFNITCRYKERVKAALESVRRGDHGIMSMIIDGMDQNNCKVPYDGSQCTFSNALKQVRWK